MDIFIASGYTTTLGGWGASHQLTQVLVSVNFNFCFYHYVNTIKDLQEYGIVESQKLCRTDQLTGDRLWNHRNLGSRLGRDDGALIKGMNGGGAPNSPSAMEPFLHYEHASLWLV